MANLIDAVELLKAGDWQAAHLIAQADESIEGSWAHGIVHLLEGDRANAGYWYRKAKRPLPPDGAIDAEISALADALRRRPRWERVSSMAVASARCSRCRAMAACLTRATGAPLSPRNMIGVA